jgi:D-beta-D-heptose 7-phosphate kinase/D-beta-D-heptose 1-phosphate adenosyltransferase
MKRIVLITGGFDPLHSGHIAYINAARELGDSLIVGVNSDEWLRRKKGQEFMPWEERATIIAALHKVDRVINFDDSDNSAKDAIRKVRAIYPSAQIVFANGGDRTKENIPEMDLLEEMLHLDFVFGVGGENKKNSSSWILQEWKAPKTERPWGYYRVLHEDGPRLKLKELTVDPGKKLSMQRHQYRNEHWFVTEGTAIVNTLDEDGNVKMRNFVMQNMQIYISRNEWHQLVNEKDIPLKVIEIQFGEKCIEEDIERK